MQHLAWHTAFRLSVLAIVPWLLGCEKEGTHCIQQRGEQGTEVREIAPFTHLELKDVVDVEWIVDSVTKVEVEYGVNGLGGIQTKVSGDTLYIFEQNRCDWARKRDPKPKVTLHHPSVRSIHSRSAGTLSMTGTLHSDSLWVAVNDAAGSMSLQLDVDFVNLEIHTGATDVTLEGTCHVLYAYNAGYAPLLADGLVARKVFVHNNSSGDSYIRAWESVYTQVYHVGDIYVAGNPTIERWHESGGGQVFRQ